MLLTCFETFYTFKAHQFSARNTTMRSLVQAAFLATLMASSIASAYQVEVGAGYSSVSPDMGGDIDTLAIGADYYLTPVKNDVNPLAEAAFLSKASAIGLGYANVDDGTNDADALSLRTEYYVPNSEFYVSGALTRVDNGVDEDTLFDANVGYFFAQNFLATVGAKDDGQDHNLAVGAKYVTKWGQNTVNLEGGLLFADDTAVSVAADYYVDSTFSVGAGITDSGAAGSDPVYNINARKFFTPAVAVGVSYMTTDGADGFGINLTGRF